MRLLAYGLVDYMFVSHRLSSTRALHCFTHYGPPGPPEPPPFTKPLHRLYLTYTAQPTAGFPPLPQRHLPWTSLTSTQPSLSYCLSCSRLPSLPTRLESPSRQRTTRDFLWIGGIEYKHALEQSPKSKSKPLRLPPVRGNGMGTGQLATANFHTHFLLHYICSDFSELPITPERSA